MNLNLNGWALDLAPQLLGAHLESRIAGEPVRVRVTEVEAYEGACDPASHAYRGKSNRNAVMFGRAGGVYVYRHMGLHWCMNLTCGPVGQASAILIRAGEVVAGESTAWSRRNAAGVCRTPRDLARGPARLTQALGVNGEHNGVQINEASLFLYPSNQTPSISTGPRIGVSKEGADPERFPWRFWITDDPFVSR